MIEIQKHIKDLLILHDCVIIPQIGGFVVNSISASYNETTGIFTPPGREIIFNRNLSHNDGLLYNYIAQRCNLKYSEAQEAVNNIIREWMNSLKNNGVILLSDLGSLRSDLKGNLIFNSSGDYNITPDTFGLSTFHFKSLEQLSEIEKPTRHLVHRTVQSKSVRQIAASVALVLGLLLITPEINNSGQFASYSSLLPSTGLKNSSEIVTNTITEDSPVKIEESNISIVKSFEVENNYFLIGGSFKKMTQAETFVKRLSLKNITTAIILPTNNGRIRVSLQGFTSKIDALEALNNYRKQNGFKSVWIYTAK